MNGVERDTRMLRDLSRYADMNSAEIAREVGVHKTTIWRYATGKADTRLSQPVLDKLRARFPKFDGWSDYLAAETGLPEAKEGAYSSEQLGWLHLLCNLAPDDRDMVLQLARHLSLRGGDGPSPAVHDNGTIDFWGAKLGKRR